MVRQYPVIRKDAKTTVMVYQDSLTALVKDVPGETNADKFDSVVKYWYDNKDVTNLEYMWNSFFKKRVQEEIKNA